MCKKENILRLQIMIDRMNKIFEICEEKGIYEALSDSKLYRPAKMIGVNLKKLCIYI